MKRILITGKDSYVGVSVKNYLEQWPKQYKVEELDVKGDSWKSFDFSKYDVIFHVAGIAHVDTKKVSEDEKKLYYDVNTNLAEAVAKVAKKQGIKQFIYMSSAIVYGDSAPIGKKKVITEDTKPAPSNFYGDSKLQAEIRLNKLADKYFKVVIVRPPMIYGKGCKGNYPTLRKIALKSPIFPKVKNERSMMYIKNFAEFIKQVIDKELKGTYNPSNKETIATYEIVKEIAKINDKKILIIPGTGWVVKLASHTTKFVNKAFGNLSYDEGIISKELNYFKYSTLGSVKDVESEK